MEILNDTNLVIDSTLIDEKIQRGYNFNLGDYLSQGWEIFKKEWLTFSIYSLLMLVIIFIASITIIGLLFVIYPLLLGYFIGAEKVNRGENLSIGDMFGGFKKLPKLALLTLIPVAIMALVSLPFSGAFIGFANMADANGSMDDVFGGAAMGSLMLMYLLMFIV